MPELDFKAKLKTLLNDGGRILANGIKGLSKDWQDDVRVGGLASDLNGHLVTAIRNNKPEMIDWVVANLPWFLDYHRLRFDDAKLDALGRIVEVAGRTAFAVADIFSGGLAGLAGGILGEILKSEPSAPAPAPAAPPAAPDPVDPPSVSSGQGVEHGPNAT